MSGVNDQLLIDVSQNNLRSKLRKYLRATNRANECNLIHGHCSGFSSLMAYSLYLSSIQKKIQQPSDNYEWLQATFHRLAKWNANIDDLSDEDKINFDLLINHIVFLHNADDYLGVNQGDLHRYMEDTRGRKPQLEYTLAGLFTANDFIKKLRYSNQFFKSSLIDELLKYDRRMILISRGGHTLSLFKYRGQICFYNPNYEAGLQFFRVKEKEELINALFTAYKYPLDKACQFGFRIYTFDKHTKRYRHQPQLLAKINGPVFEDDENNNKTHSALKMAARIGCSESLKYYLNKTTEVDHLTTNTTALYEATGNGYLDIVRLLINYGADPYKVCNKKTALRHAEKKGHQDIVEYIQQNSKTPIIKPLFFKQPSPKQDKLSLTATMLKL